MREGTQRTRPRESCLTLTLVVVLLFGITLPFTLVDLEANQSNRKSLSCYFFFLT